MFSVTLVYNNYSSYLSGNFVTIEEARADLQKMIAYYRALDYPILSAEIDKQCTSCHGEKAFKKCRHKYHAFYIPKCFKPCTACQEQGYATVETLDLCS
jgi:hypothetical protein